MESQIEVIHQGFEAHTEKVDKGSATPFEAVLRHRFGQGVTAAIEARLDGKQDLTPTSIPTPPGTLTYTAPSDDGGKARVKMTSTSKQGIGILVIAFETEAAKGLTGTLTLVEDWRSGENWTTRRLTVNGLLPRAGFDGVTGWFDDDGSTYKYEGSGLNHSGDRECFIDQTWASTGNGPFGSTGRAIGLLIDQSPGGASLRIDVRFATNYSVSTTCFGETRTTTSSDDQDGWGPVCGANSGSGLEGRVGSSGRIDFACKVPIQPGTGSLTVTGSLTRR